MPAIKRPIDAGQEDAVEVFLFTAVSAVQAGNMARHEVTSC
jgi:hypothetical protein